jgi:hypothetical protein
LRWTKWPEGQHFFWVLQVSLFIITTPVLHNNISFIYHWEYINLRNKWHYEIKKEQKAVIYIQTRFTDLPNISVSSVHQYMAKHQKMCCIEVKSPLSAHTKNCEKWLLALSCLSVHQSTWNSSAPSEWIFMKFDISVFFENLSWKLKFDWNLTRITGTLCYDLCTLWYLFQFFFKWGMF